MVYARSYMVYVGSYMVYDRSYMVYVNPIWFMLDPICFMLDPINLPDKDSAQLTTYISSGSLTRVISNFLILFTRSCNTLECFVKLTKEMYKIKVLCR